MISLRAAQRGWCAPARLLVLALGIGLVAACGGGPSPTVAPTGPGPSSSPPPATPTAGPTDVPTPAPTGSPTDAPTDAPSPTSAPTDEPSSPPEPAGDCTGSDDNRAFFAAVAADVAWDVYCPVLPAGWFVDAGSFRLAGGGRLEIAYRGPGGARLEIREGAYCGDDPACIPDGPDDGTAAFGDLPARVVDLGGGRWLVVAEGGKLNWEVRTSGLARAVAVEHAASFVRVVP